MIISSNHKIDILFILQVGEVKINEETDNTMHNIDNDFFYN